MDKTQLRQHFRTVLLEMSPEDRAERSRKICRNLIDTEQFAKVATVMTYLSLPHEVDTAEVILCAWQKGKTVAAPKISWQQRHMIPVEITTLETGFSTEVAGLRNPVKGVPVPFEEIGMVITPGLGFDKKGNRLGRGSSYYDRFFTNERLNAVRCGLAFSEQVVDHIATTKHDVPVDMLVTDETVMYFNSAKP
jgi:5-formyltetrahydrofolate cyclo-ligase